MNRHHSLRTTAMAAASAVGSLLLIVGATAPPASAAAAAAAESSTKAVASCRGRFTAQIRTGSYAGLSLTGRLAISKDPTEVPIGGVLSDVDDNGKPFVVATVAGKISGNRASLTFTTPGGTSVVGSAAAGDLGGCGSLKGALSVSGGKGTGYWILTPDLDQIPIEQREIEKVDGGAVLPKPVVRDICGKFKGTIVYEDSSSVDCSTGKSYPPTSSSES